MTIPERLSRLETKTENHEKDISEVAESFSKLVEEVKGIRLRLEKSISFLGGISFTFSMFGAAFGAAVIFLLRKVGLDI